MIGKPIKCPFCGSSDIRWYIDTYYCGTCEKDIPTGVKDPFLEEKDDPTLKE